MRNFRLDDESVSRRRFSAGRLTILGVCRSWNICTTSQTEESGTRRRQ